jgi:hypothetical protein
LRAQEDEAETALHDLRFQYSLLQKDCDYLNEKTKMSNAGEATVTVKKRSVQITNDHESAIGAMHRQCETDICMNALA